MTGISSFFVKSQSQSFTIKDATLISQSFTSMDARTKQKDKPPIPKYPEPDGDPSY